MCKKIIIILAVLIINSGCTGKTSEELYANGLKLQLEGKSGSAIVFFKNALEKNQNYLDARYQLAKAYMSEKKYELAEREFQKVKLLKPNQLDIKLDLAKIYNYLGKPDMALSQADEYLKVNADAVDALEVIGIAYRIKKMPNEAETFFLRAIQKEPGKMTAKLELAALYLAQGKAENARLLLEEIVKSKPENVRALYLLADSETVRGKKNEALSIYKKLGEINASDPVAPYKAGLLHFEMRQFDIAERIAGELIDKFPSDSNGYRLKGIVLYSKKDFHEAIPVLQKANKLQPSVVGNYFLGLSLYGNGELESALDQFRHILDNAPSFHQARLFAGMIHLQQKRFDDAISELNKLLETDGKNAQAHNILGSAYIAKGLYEEGMKELDSAIKIDPRLVDAYLKKGMILLRQGKNAEVEVNFTTAIRMAPELQNTRLILASFHEHRNNSSKAFATLKEGLTGKKSDEALYCGMARIMFSTKNPAEAMRYINKAKEINPDAVAPHFILAAYHAANRDVDEAIKEYSVVLNKDPGNVKVMLSMASLLESAGQENEALAMYMKAKETHNPSAYLALSRFYEKKGGIEKPLLILADADRYVPRSADLLEQKVRLYLKNGQYKDALKTCDDLEAISPERVVSTKVAAYMAMKKWPEAVKEAERAINLKPGSSYGYMILASVYEKQNNSGLAIETLKKGVQRDRNNPQTALSLAVLYAKSGNHSMAMKTCDDILSKRPNYAPAYFTQGTFLETKGNKKEAIKKYRAALAQSSDYAAALNNLAYLYLEGYGSKEEALRLAESAIALEPENPRIMDTLGYALLKNSRHSEACKNLERAVAFMPGDPNINYHLALAYQASGYKKQAVECLQVALRSEDFAGIQQARNLLVKLN